MSKEIIFIIAGAALVTYCTRFPLLVFSGSKVPKWVEQYFCYLAPAILTALIAPFVFLKNNSLNISFQNDYLIATILTGLVAYFSKSTLAAVLTGVLTVGFTVWLSVSI
jgi:branched-subunit amino acid transport protein